MATYLVGDVQGCLTELKLILQQVDFSPEHDELWLTGDLVARGSESLETMRFVRKLGARAQTVLGNHDLHLLATASGLVKAKPKDQLNALLEANDRDELLDWLRHQPLVARHPRFEFFMTHAGIPPAWSTTEAALYASEVEAWLQSGDYQTLLKAMYGNEPSNWDAKLTGIDRCRYTINALTRMRYCDRKTGALDMTNKCGPGQMQDKRLRPWFELRSHHQDPPLIFGHWASLMGKTQTKDVFGLDTGCVWGNYLTLLRWEDKKRFVQGSVCKNRPNP
jgi:bis(5'-nucleosyl)-tetraphosphatase (symmetrical)